MSLTIGVDVGGTKVAAGVVDDRGRIIEKLRRSTPAVSPRLTEQVIAEVVRTLASRHEVTAVGVGAAGFVAEGQGVVLFAPNLAWRDEPVQEQVAKLVGLPVIVENDANAGGVGRDEVRRRPRPAARRADHRRHRDRRRHRAGGELYRGRWGIAGEPGHYRVVPDGRLCGCGNRGCWEQYASGNALVAEAREFARRSPGAAVRLLQLGGGSPEGIDGLRGHHGRAGG